MRHDTRKINEENPLVIRGLYGGGGGGGGGGDGGDSAGPGIGGAGIGIGAGDVGIGAGIGTGIGGASSVSGAGIGDVGSGIGSGIGSVGGGGGGTSPGTIASVANTLAGLFGMGIPSIGGVIGPGLAVTGTAALANGLMSMHGLTSPGTPGTGTGDPGSASSPGGGMAYDQFGNFMQPSWGIMGNGGIIYGGGQSYGNGVPYFLTPQSQREAQDWRDSGFDPAAYLRANPDVAADPYYSTHPWQHFYEHGVHEGRTANGQPRPAAPAPAAPAAPNPNSPDAIRQAQLELVQQQRDIATQMQQRQQALQDQLMAQQGYEPDGAGGYRLNATAQAAQDQQNQIAAQLRQRTLDALAGNLPVDPALERGLGEQRRTLEATLRGNLGSGFETSTPGIEALANFDKRAEELRAQQRHDQLTTAEGLRLAGSQVSNTASTQNLANVLGITNSGSVPAGLLSSAAGGLSPIGQNLLGYSSLDNALRIAQLTGQNSQSELAQRLAAQDNAGYGQLVGQLGSAFLRSDYAGDIIKNVGSGLGSLWDSIGSIF